ALMQLAGRMQEARSVTGRCGHPQRISQVRSNLLNQRLAFRSFLDVIEQRDVVSGSSALQVRSNKGIERKVAKFFASIGLTTDRETACFSADLLRWKGAFFLVELQEPLGVVLAFLNIRLVKRVDTDDRSGHCRSDLPDEKLLTQVESVIQAMSDHRMTSG